MESLGWIFFWIFIGYCGLMVVGSGLYWLWELVADRGFARRDGPNYLVGAAWFVALFTVPLAIGLIVT